MYLLSGLHYPEEYKGRLAVLENSEESTIYVIWEVNQEKKSVMLVELDRPQDGDTKHFHLKDDNVYILEPIEVVERVTTWE
ncbi:hypothetical protein CVD28_00980 [Bacillus sp. M6-12]|uniref:hypothetical protein n=1 Tax=Bacillus sp. M6-12 TaxID=2054166 RepID=UPI000C7930FD|nr:hypothetical protein [Bacillus sp. M6-12]PLS19007.1 hypothetical protein CVD28_00980 [Bacillus sp. M6-12]